MAFKYNVAFKEPITSKGLNDKIAMLLERNGIINGFNVTSDTGNKIKVKQGSAVINGCLITMDEDTKDITININNDPVPKKYIVYLEYTHKSSGGTSECQVKVNEDNICLNKNNTIVLAYVTRYYNKNSVSNDDIENIDNSIKMLGSVNDVLNELVDSVNYLNSITRGSLDISNDCNVVITHNLNDYPDIKALTETGYGDFGYGDFGYGGTNNLEIKCRTEYIDKNTIRVYFEKDLGYAQNIKGDNSEKEITFSSGAVVKLIIDARKVVKTVH